MYTCQTFAIHPVYTKRIAADVNGDGIYVYGHNNVIMGTLTLAESNGQA